MGIGTSLVWIFLGNHVPEISQAVYGVSDRLFGNSDLPYSRAGIRILAEEERKNRIVIIYLFIDQITTKKWQGSPDRKPWGLLHSGYPFTNKIQSYLSIPK